MTRTFFYTATTLDGYLADEQDSLHWLFGQQQDEDGPLSYDAFIAGIGAIAMGRTTFEWILDHEAGRWPYSQPSWVFTHAELTAPEGADVRLVQGDVAPVHAAMVEAAADQDLWVAGGGDLAAQFAEAGLLDQLQLMIAPVTLGAGRPLLPRPFDLRLVTLERNGAFACATYDVVGPLTQSGT